MLSEVNKILPPTIGFGFDREKRTNKESVKLEARSGGKATLTNRMPYEIYLLNSRAIAHVASRTEDFREGGEISSEEHKRETKYSDAEVQESVRNDGFWLPEVDGARLLKDMFAALSDNRVTYGKVADGAKLTRWLCENARDDLEELACLIEERWLDRRH